LAAASGWGASLVRVIGKPLASRLRSAGQLKITVTTVFGHYRVVGKRLALVSKSAGQRTKRIFEALCGL